LCVPSFRTVCLCRLRRICLSRLLDCESVHPAKRGRSPFSAARLPRRARGFASPDRSGFAHFEGRKEACSLAYSARRLTVWLGELREFEKERSHFPLNRSGVHQYRHSRVSLSGI